MHSAQCHIKSALKKKKKATPQSIGNISMEQRRKKEEKKKNLC
jgi:hypothetical protein